MKVYIVLHGGQFGVGVIGAYETLAEAVAAGKKKSGYGADYTIRATEIGSGEVEYLGYVD